MKAIKYTSSCGSLSSGEGSAPRALDTRGAVAYTRRPHLCTSRGGVRPGGVALDKRAPQAAQAQGLGPGLPAKESHPALGRSDGVWPSLGTSASGSVMMTRSVRRYGSVTMPADGTLVRDEGCRAAAARRWGGPPRAPPLASTSPYTSRRPAWCGSTSCRAGCVAGPSAPRAGRTSPPASAARPPRSGLQPPSAPARHRAAPGAGRRSC